MSQFRYLTEARIRDYNRRKEAGETLPSKENLDRESLESMLFDKIVELRTPLRHTSDEDAARALRRQIQNLETQLLVSFESTGRPLLVQLVAEKLQEEAQREESSATEE